MQATQSDHKVVSIFERKLKQGDSEKKDSGDLNDLDLIMQKNRDNAERMKQERLKANRSVLKSYKIKP